MTRAWMALMVLVPMIAGAESKPFTPKDIARLSAVGAVKISPDGRFVAYSKYVQRTPFEGKDGRAHSELHVVDAQGQSRPWVTGQVGVHGVSWTKDGSGIAFVAKREGDAASALYVIPVDGGEAQRVLSPATGVSGYSFSPYGDRVAWMTREKGDNGAGDDRSKGFDQELYEEDRGRTTVFVSRVDGEGDPVALAIEGSAHAVRWAPRGEQIAVVVAPTPLVDDKYMQSRVWIFDGKSGKKLAALANPGKLGDFRWSPNARRLALISGADINDPRAGRILVMDADGDAPGRFLLMEAEGHVFSLAWRDSSTIAYAMDRGVLTELGEIGAGGKDHEVHLEASGPWSALDLAADGETYAIRGESPRHPNEVFRGVLGKGAPKRLTDGNPWLANKALGAQEVVEYEARDGLKLQGLLIKPTTWQKGTRYPLILFVHGGPESHYRNGWLTRYSLPAQVAASRGFVSFYPNYRGSTGRGLAFSKTSQADPAGKEFDDLVDAVDHLVKAGLVDRARVGITGGSYGGYASAWAATKQTKHFAASVMFVGISNKLSKSGTTDIPHEGFHVHDRKRIWGNWQFFLERSAVYYVEQARTPILIAHGRDDPRVNKGQAMELYRHLKVLGNVPVRLVFYPGEGHGNRRAASRLDLSLRLLRWMEHYLAPNAREKPIPPKALDYRKEWVR